MYHDIFWIDTKAKITNIEYAYRGYTETFETIHPVKTIKELENITGEKNTYFIFLNYHYQITTKNFTGNYQFNNMGAESSQPFFDKIKTLKINNELLIKINPNNYSINLPKRETKLNGKEDNLLTPVLWIIVFLTIAILYIKDFKNKKVKSR